MFRIVSNRLGSAVSTIARGNIQRQSIGNSQLIDLNRCDDLGKVAGSPASNSVAVSVDSRHAFAFFHKRLRAELNGTIATNMSLLTLFPEKNN